MQALYARATDDSDKVSKDPYFVGLVAASLYNVGRKEEGYKLATRLRTWQQPDSGSVSDAAGTITCSGGRARDIEVHPIPHPSYTHTQAPRTAVAHPVP